MIHLNVAFVYIFGGYFWKNIFSDFDFQLIKLIPVIHLN